MAEFFFRRPMRMFFTDAPLDWVETSSSHVIRVNVPGCTKDDIKITLSDDALHIKAEAKEEKEKEKDVMWHAKERGHGYFERSIALPENVKTDNIKAAVENGVVTVVLPKEPVPAKPRPRAIPISSKL